jgi:uncharacterized protein
MEMVGERTIPTERNKVWESLNDPQVLKECIPGCESIEGGEHGEYRVKLVAVIGPIKAKFSGKMTLTDLDPPNAYRILFEGQGGPAGFAKGEAAVRLEPAGPATRMTYDVKAQVGGKIAQVGARLIDGVAKKVADEFFDAFSHKVGTPEPAEGAPGALDANVRPPSAALRWAGVAALLLLSAIAAYFLLAD